MRVSAVTVKPDIILALVSKTQVKKKNTLSVLVTSVTH